MITLSTFIIRLSAAGRTVAQRSFPYLEQSLESFVRISFSYIIWETVPDTGSLVAKRFKSIPGSIDSWNFGLHICDGTQMCRRTKEEEVGPTAGLPTP